MATPSPRLTCPMCGQALKNPQILPFVYLFALRQTGKPDDFNTSKVNAHYLVGWPGRYLHQWHIKLNVTPIHSDPMHVTDTTPCAVFGYDRQSRQWHLKNLTLSDMLYRLPNDRPESWRPCFINMNIPIEMGVSIQFGDTPDHYRAHVEMVRVGL